MFVLCFVCVIESPSGATILVSVCRVGRVYARGQRVPKGVRVFLFFRRRARGLKGYRLRVFIGLRGGGEGYVEDGGFSEAIYDLWVMVQ